MRNIPGSREDTIFIGVLYLDKNPLLLLRLSLWKAGWKDIVIEKVGMSKSKDIYRIKIYTGCRI